MFLAYLQIIIYDIVRKIALCSTRITGIFDTNIHINGINDYIINIFVTQSSIKRLSIVYVINSSYFGSFYYKYFELFPYRLFMFLLSFYVVVFHMGHIDFGLYNKTPMLLQAYTINT